MSAPVTPSVRGRHAPRWGFAVFAALSAIHVAAIAVGAAAVIGPTKLLLMPALGLAVVVARGRGAWRPTEAWLLLAIALSWLGDGAAVFFPFLPELPMMLLCFGLAHLAYIALFARLPGARRVPLWTTVYAAWWVGMLILLWPHLGPLQVAVAGYGLVLGGTAAMSARAGVLTAVGGAFFLASDTLLALRLFLPGVSESLAGPWIMATYTIGQGLLAWGILRRTR